MKYLIALLFSMNAHATGKLSLEPSYDAVNEKSHATFGLTVYEKVDEGIFYTSWTGLGDSTDVDTKYQSWYVTKHQIDIKAVEHMVVSPGVRFNYKAQEDEVKNFTQEVFAKVTYEIW